MMQSARKIRKFAKALATRTLEFEIERMPFRLQNVSPRKLLTAFLSELNCARSRPGSPWYPSRLMIEPSSVCTLRCPLCPLGRGAMTRPRMHMPLATFRAIMDEVGDHSVFAQLWMYGEPFASPDICRMISYAREKNVATVASTNGQHIQTREDAEALVASGLDNLIIALDGAGQETLGRYRLGASFDKVLNCMGLISRARKSLGSAKPLINLRTVVMKQNEHELPEIAEIAREHGADMVSHKTAFMADCDDPGVSAQFVPEDSAFRRFRHRDGETTARPGNQFGCRRPWDRLSVTADGTVISCEYDYNLTVPWGHPRDGVSFMEAWRSDAARAFRRQFLADETVYPFCANCSCGWLGSREATTKDMVYLTACGTGARE